MIVSLTVPISLLELNTIPVCMEKFKVINLVNQIILPLTEMLLLSLCPRALPTITL